MPSDDARWIPLPQGTRPGQLSRGDIVEVRPGERVVVEGSSTTMLLVRPLRWWERLWVRLFS